MPKSNCHTHTVFCDGKHTPEEMVRAALERGFSCLGFSVHSPMKNGADWTIQPQNLPAYLAQIRHLQQMYHGKIEILNGVELDRDYCGVDPAAFDYVIASVHQLNCGGRYYDVDYTADILRQCCEREFSGDFLRLAAFYYERLTSFVVSQKAEIVGHFDLIEKFNEDKMLFDTDAAQYQKIALCAMDEILHACPDVFFEVNTGAMFRCEKKYPYPMPFLLKHLAEKGGRVIITSDAHCTEALSFGFETAAAVCKAAGFDEVYELRQSGFVPLKI